MVRELPGLNPDPVWSVARLSVPADSTSEEKRGDEKKKRCRAKGYYFSLYVI